MLECNHIIREFACPSRFIQGGRSNMITFKVSYDAYGKIEELWSTDKFELKFS